MFSWSQIELEVRYRNKDWKGARLCWCCQYHLLSVSTDDFYLFYTTRSESYLNTFTRGVATKMNATRSDVVGLTGEFFMSISSLLFFFVFQRERGIFICGLRLNNVAVAANTLHTAVLMGICSSSSISLLTPPSDQLLPRTRKIQLGSGWDCYCHLIIFFIPTTTTFFGKDILVVTF